MGLFNSREKDTVLLNMSWEQMAVEPGTPLTRDGLRDILCKNADVACREIYINADAKIPAFLIYIEGIVNETFLNQYILAPLVQGEKFASVRSSRQAIETIRHGGVYFSKQQIRTNINMALYDVLNGSILLLFDGEQTAVSFEAKGFEKRQITPPTDENVFKGAKDSFVETLRVNTASVRQKVRSVSLNIREVIVGKQTLTPISVVYIEGIAREDIIKQVTDRLDKIDVDQALTTHIIEEYLNDNKYTLFPQIRKTERPSTFCAGILEGYVGLLIDGLPLGFILPTSFALYLHAPDDYSQPFLVASVMRIMRHALLVLTLLLPGYYIAITSFHPEMLPTPLAFSIISSQEGTPLPVSAEVLLMVIAFEVLVEAGMRLPKMIGSFLSIVGALVVGEAAIAAKFVSPGVVLVIAITAISSYTIPNQDLSIAVRLWRFLITLLCSLMGIFGLVIGALIMILNLSHLESLGVPYMAPYVDNDYRRLGDALVRLPVWMQKKKPSLLKTADKVREQ